MQKVFERVFILWLLTWGFFASAAEIKINFSDYAAGQTPTNFFSALAGEGRPGDWKIIMDEMPSAFAPLSPQAAASPVKNERAVLAQLSREQIDGHFPMLIYLGATFKDFKLTTRFKIIGGVMEQMAGIVFRFQNESNFYVVRASALGRNLRFYKVVNGQFADPSAPLSLNISTNVWHTLTVQCEGNQINCALDNAVLPSIQTPETFASGKIGFWTKSDAVTYFGDTTIDYTPVIPPAQRLVQNILAEQSRLLDLRLYALDEKKSPRVIAAKDEKEIGKTGGDAEKKTIADGTIFFGRGKDDVTLTLPLRDRNGDIIAAVCVRLKSFPGETQDAALTRATMIVKEMQAQVLSRSDLGE